MFIILPLKNLMQKDSTLSSALYPQLFSKIVTLYKTEP